MASKVLMRAPGYLFGDELGRFISSEGFCDTPGKELFPKLPTW